MTNHKAIVQQWFDAIAAGQAEDAFALFADDIVYDLKGTTPISGRYQGLKSILDDFFTPWRKQIVGDLVLKVDELIGEGERVVAVAHGSARTIFDRPYDNEYCFVFRVRNGRIVEVVEYLDTTLVETAAYGRKLV